MGNAYAQELLAQFNQRFNVDSDDMALSEWLVKNTKLKGKPFSFSRYPFQRAIADETARNAVTVKPSQVGVSEIYQRVAAGMLARNRHRKIIYAYPGDEMRKKNVQTRVKPLMEEKAFSPPMGQSWVNSIELIEINGSFLYMTGSKATDTVSTDADAVFLDEYDLHDQAQAALFSSRLQNSDWKYSRYFSTPTFTQFGVAGLYENSDQHEYLLKCDHCNHWQFPMFDPRWVVIPGLPSDWGSDLTDLTIDSIERYKMDLSNSYVGCEKCRAKLDLGREDNRAWVAKYPSRVNMRGRKVNPFSTSTRPVLDIVSELFVYKQSDYLRGFRNSVLGEPEDSSNARIGEALIRATIKSASIPDIDKEAPTYIGCDMGHTCHLTILQGENSKRARSVTLEQVPLAQIRERIVEVCSLYNVIGGTVDRHPESQVARDIWESTNGLVVPAEYRGDKEMNLIMEPDDKEKVAYIQVNRTMHLDQVAAAIKRGSLEFYGYGLLQSELLAQLRNMIRKEEPEKPAEWVKLNPNDHFFHSIGFALTAMKLRPYTELKVGPTLSMLGFATADMVNFSSSLLKSGKKQWQPEKLY